MKSIDYKALCDLCLLDPFTFLTSSPTTFPFIHSALAILASSMSLAQIRYTFASGPLHMLFLSGVLVSGYVHSPLLYFFHDLLKCHPLDEITLSKITIPQYTCQFVWIFLISLSFFPGLRDVLRMESKRCLRSPPF